MTVKVKPLVWDAMRSPIGYTAEQAHTLIGRYKVQSSPDTGHEYVILDIQDRPLARYADFDFAKAAAQADYEARILAAIEAPAQEPVAWQCKDYADGWITYTARNADQAREYQEATGCTIRPLYATQPDHLALVAAAYRNAADACDDYPRAAPEEAEWTRYDEQIAYSKACILAATPADAEAHLTALLRAEYERGVRDTLAAADREAKGKVHIGWQAFRTVKLDDLEPAALALLTQEGR